MRNPNNQILVTIGTGIISTAIKNDKAPEFIINKSIEVMTELNNFASEAMISIGVNACTDVTGYGLLGHLLEMCKASKVSAVINYNKLPLIQGVFELAEKGFIDLDVLDTAFMSEVGNHEPEGMTQQQGIDSEYISKDQARYNYLKGIIIYDIRAYIYIIDTSFVFWLCG